MDHEIFDASVFESEDTAEMTVLHPVTDKPTSWKITFAGPGHPKTVDQQNRLARRRLEEARDKERAQVNQKKWKPAEVSVEQQRRENAEFFAERMLGWTPVRLSPDQPPIVFSHENAVELLLNPKMGKLFLQVIEFVTGEDSFLNKRGASS